MLITKDLLHSWQSCPDGYAWFVKKYPDGAELQDVLDALCEERTVYDAHWLLNKAGPQKTVLEITNTKFPRKHLVFAGSISIEVSCSFDGFVEAGEDIKAGGNVEAGWHVKAGGSVEAGGHVKAGWNVEAGGHVEAGEHVEAGGSVEAGEDIKAGGNVEAGEDYGIFAGLRIKVSQWSLYAKVIAKTKPQNLMTGFWSGK